MRVLLLILIVASAPLAAAQPAVAPCEVVRGRLLLPVQLNNSTTCLMALDLAAQHLVLDPRVATAFGLETLETKVTAADPAQRPVQSPVVSVNFAPAPGLLQVDSAALQDLSGLSASLGREVGGILPAHLPGYEVTLDFAAAEILWRDLAHASLSAASDNTVKMTVSESGAPIVQGAINDQHLHPLELDLFCTSSLSLPQSMVTTLRLPPETPRLQVHDSAQQLIRLQRLKVGDTQLADPLCAVAEDERPARLGLPFLRQFRITLNYEAGLCRFDPSSGNMLQEPALIGTGITLQRMEQGYWRIRVLEGSPAARAGAQSGDYLVTVGEKTVAALPALTVEKLLQTEIGQRQLVGLARDGKPLTVDVVAERLL